MTRRLAISTEISGAAMILAGAAHCLVIGECVAPAIMAAVGCSLTALSSVLSSKAQDGGKRRHG